MDADGGGGGCHSICGPWTPPKVPKRGALSLSAAPRGDIGGVGRGILSKVTPTQQTGGVPGGRLVDSGSVQRASKYAELGSTVVCTSSVGRIEDVGASALCNPPPPCPCSLGVSCNFKVKSFCKVLTSIFPPRSPSDLQGRVGREPDGKSRGEERRLVPV